MMSCAKSCVAREPVARRVQRVGPWRGPCDQTALRAAADAVQLEFATWQPASGTLPDYRAVVRALQAACPGLPHGWKIAHQASMALNDAAAVRAGEVIDLGSLDVTRGMVAQAMPWLEKPRRRPTK